MTNLFYDAHAWPANSTDLGRQYTLTGTASVSSSGGPYGNPYITALGSASEVVIERTTSGAGTPKQVRLRFWGKMDKTGTPAPSASSSDMVYFLNTTAAVACSMTFRPSVDTLGFYRGAGSNLIDDEVFDADDGVWKHYEIHLQIGDADGAVRVWVDTVLKLTADNTDTDAAATSGNTITGFGFKANRVDNSNYVNFSIADVVIDDGTFGTQLGKHRMSVLVPTSDDSVQFTRSTGSDSYALLDENPVGTSDYVQSSTLNQQDTFNMSDLPYTPATIWCVEVDSWCLRSSGTSCTLTSVLVSGATTDLGAGTSLGTTLTTARERFDLDPNTGAAWTASGVNALKSGHKLTATAGSGVARVYNHQLTVVHSLQEAVLNADSFAINVIPTASTKDIGGASSAVSVAVAVQAAAAGYSMSAVSVAVAVSMVAAGLQASYNLAAAAVSVAVSVSNAALVELIRQVIRRIAPYAPVHTAFDRLFSARTKRDPLRK
jgi:hypothetical protein